MNPFTPQFLFEDEFTSYGLPSATELPEVVSLVQFASSLIDEYCGRVDGTGNGSLVYTTYVERILLQTRNRNLAMLAFKPMVGVDASTVAQLSASGSASGTNIYYTGVQANTTLNFNGELNSFVGCSGRYGYTRQDRSVGYPDLYAMINPLNLVTMFGGPAPWVQVAIDKIDYDRRTGECWFPAGLQLQAYSELICVYNSGFDPRYMPRPIKNVCASLVKNLMAKGNATTALMTVNLGRGAANIGMLQGSVIDPTLDTMLTPFKVIRSY